jgi:zinc protease
MGLKRFFALVAATVLLTVASFAQTLPQGVQKVTSVEGVTEYAFPNGLHVLLFPDNSKPKITVNVVYLVGSRNEAYGETGMAHLLEHMTFKSAEDGRELFKDLTNRAGGNFNGTTNYDQTMYFETVNASDDNLRWALDLETDRMAHMTMLKKDLDSEMTVVRNEMEAGENSQLNVLDERVMAAAYNFHNYGKTVIGDRTDVERVPIANLAAFYHKYYQPDDADLIIAGQFDPSKALAMVSQTLGALPRPERVLTQPYTVEPTQEGERFVTLRRIGDIQAIIAVYHIPAALHPDIAPLEVMSQVLGAPQTGRLYKALVDTKKAVAVSMGANDMHDPGVELAFVQLKPEQSIDDAQQILLKTVEGLPSDPPTQEEVDRAKARIEKNIELALTDSQQVALMLGGYAGDGDWRSFYLMRDEVNKVTPADVTRVAKAYLKSSNRTLGEFIPTKTPDRAEIPPTPDPAARFKDYHGGAAIQEGETFDPTPQNIEARVIRAKLPNGLKLVMFPRRPAAAPSRPPSTSASATRSRSSTNPPPEPWLVACSCAAPPPRTASRFRMRPTASRRRSTSPATPTPFRSPSAHWTPTSRIRCASPANSCANPASPPPNSNRSASSASPAPRAAGPTPQPWPPWRWIAT